MIQPDEWVAIEVGWIKWMVIRKKDTEPVECYPFAYEADARAWFLRAREQWSETYLVHVIGGPFE